MMATITPDLKQVANQTEPASPDKWHDDLGPAYHHILPLKTPTTFTVFYFPFVNDINFAVCQK